MVTIQRGAALCASVFAISGLTKCTLGGQRLVLLSESKELAHRMGKKIEVRLVEMILLAQ